MHVTSRKENNRAVIQVSDSGKGFPGADSKGRVKPEKIKSSKSGGGFGFKYIRYFIQQYKGTLEISNIPDTGADRSVSLYYSSMQHGATITVSLPLIEGYDINRVIDDIMTDMFYNGPEFFFKPVLDLFKHPLFRTEYKLELMEWLTGLINQSIAAMKATPIDGKHELTVRTFVIDSLAEIMIKDSGY